MGEKLIAFVFIVESSKGIIKMSIIHKRLVDSPFPGAVFVKLIQRLLPPLNSVSTI